MVFPSLSLLVAMESSTLEAERTIDQRLTAAGVPFHRNVALEGMRLDFRATTATRQVVLEVKRVPLTAQALARAGTYAKTLRRVLGDVNAFLVIPGLRTSSPKAGLLSDKDAAEHVLRLLAPTLHKGVLRAARRQPGTVQQKARAKLAEMRYFTPETVFVAMPFDHRYDDVYLVAMREAARRVGLACVRVDDQYFSGEIISKIRDEPRNAKAVMADVSEAKPNVMYEVGYAHALRKPTVHISRTPPEQLPFDVRSWDTIQYSEGGTARLRPRLLKGLRDALRSLPESGGRHLA